MPKSHTTRPYSKLGYFAIPLLVCMVGMSLYFPTNEYAPEGFSSHIIAFEFAENTLDLHQVFDPLNKDQIEAINTGNYIDFVFMVFYSALLFFFFMLSQALTSYGYLQRFMRFGMILSGIALLGDILENIQLIAICNKFLAHDFAAYYRVLLERLHLFTWIKWEALAVAFAFLAFLLFSRGTWSKIVGLLLILPFMTSIWALWGYPEAISLFTTTVFIAFFLTLIYSLTYLHPPPD